MIAIIKRSYGFMAARPRLRLALQAAVSLSLIALLIVAARQTNLIANFATIQPAAILAALALQILAFVLNSKRWQLLLANAGVEQKLGDLVTFYFIGR